MYARYRDAASRSATAAGVSFRRRGERTLRGGHPRDFFPEKSNKGGNSLASDKMSTLNTRSLKKPRLNGGCVVIVEERFPAFVRVTDLAYTHGANDRGVKYARIRVCEAQIEKMNSFQKRDKNRRD